MDWKQIVRVCIFLLIGFILFQNISYVLRDKKYADREAPFFDEKKNSIDILLIGPSTMDLAISPMELYHNYGYTAYNLANGGQSLPINYWCLKNALRRQKPDLVVIDLSYLHMQDKLARQPARLSQFVDNMPFSLDKVECILDLAETDQWKDYLLNIRMYHTRWKELTVNDFRKITSINKGGTVSFKRWKDYSENPPVRKLYILDKADKKDVDEYKISIEYIEKIISLCEEQGCELLFIMLPAYATGETNHGDGEELQRLWNGFYDYAAENGVAYLNFLHEIEEIGIDFNEDFYDWRHMNYWGNLKMTHYLGKYISENYAISDRRDDTAYMDWDDAYLNYETYIQHNIEAGMQED